MKHPDTLHGDDDLTEYPRVIRDRLRRAPHREQTGFPPGYDHEYELLLEQSPENATHAELHTVLLIRQQLNPDFTVEDLRTNRTQAITEARSTANLLEVAGAHDSAAAYRTLADMLAGQHDHAEPESSVSVGGR